ncbi:MAG TPA: hypothetical protein VGN81_33870 [Pseudonocardiaceae bacterium]|jgi:hypothetical protein
MPVRHRQTGLVFAALSVLVVAFNGGCSATPAPGPATTPPTSISAPAIDIAEQANNSTLHLHPGQIVHIGLHNTYWSDPVSTAPAILSIEGTVTRTHEGGCPIGSGCGTVSARFVATKPGTARLEAHRSSCGEAMACSPSQRQFTVTVTIN